MAKSITSDKRENEKKKLARRAEKLKKRENRKLAGKENFDDIIAYVDENGVITSTPPEVNAKKEEIKQEEIIISTPKKCDEIPTVQKGRIEFYNTSKGYGFIKNLLGTDKYFFHINNVKSSVAENDIVTFDLERGPKGLNAINVCLENKSGK